MVQRERLLWGLAVLFYGLGDVGTTFVGLSLGGVSEAGPVAGPALDAFGVAGLVGLKVVMFGAFYGVWRLLAPPGRVAIPLALVAVGGVVTGWNGLMILIA